MSTEMAECTGRHPQLRQEERRGGSGNGNQPAVISGTMCGLHSGDGAAAPPMARPDSHPRQQRGPAELDRDAEGGHFGDYRLYLPRNRFRCACHTVE